MKLLLPNRRRLIRGATLLALAAPAIISARPADAIGLMGADPGGPSPNVAFNPTQLIIGGGGFWRADMGVTGSPVTQWNDQTSFANNLTTQASCGSQTSPTFSSTGFNTSFPGITTTIGSTKGLGVSVGFASTTVSLFILLNFGSANTSSAQICWDQGASSTFVGGFELGAASTTGFFAGGNNAVIGNGGANVDPGLVAGTNYILGFVADGTHGNVFINGVAQGAQTTSSATYGSNATNFLGFGCSNSATAAAMTVAYWGVTQHAMSAGDWTNLKTWTNSNWGTSF